MRAGSSLTAPPMSWQANDQPDPAPIGWYSAGRVPRVAGDEWPVRSGSGRVGIGRGDPGRTAPAPAAFASEREGWRHREPGVGRPQPALTVSCLVLVPALPAELTTRGQAGRRTQGRGERRLDSRCDRRPVRGRRHLDDRPAGQRRARADAPGDKGVTPQDLVNAGSDGHGAAREGLLPRQPLLAHQARARRIGHQPDAPPGRKLVGESRHELRSLDDHGHLAQVTGQDVVEHELQPEPAGGLEGVRGGFSSPGELIVQRFTCGQPGLVIIGPQVDRVQRQVIRPGQVPGQGGLPRPLPAANPQHRRPLSP